MTTPNDTSNSLENVNIAGNYIGRDQITINQIQEAQQGFVITCCSDDVQTAYFTGREEELQSVQRLLDKKGKRAILVKGMGGIGKTTLCRKLYHDYIARHARGEHLPFKHIGYISYNDNIGSSLVACLSFPRDMTTKGTQEEIAWAELARLASNGQLLLFVDNVTKSVREDPDLKRLFGLPAAIVLTSRLAYFEDSGFEPVELGFLPLEHCRIIYRKITKGSDLEEPDLDYIISQLAAFHTLTVELLAYTARCHGWTPADLRKQLEHHHFRLNFVKGGEIDNIQQAYETLFSLAALSEGEINILEAFSLFPYLPLPDQDCTDLLLQDAGEETNSLQFYTLYEKGWLQYSQSCYQMHPVFAQFIADTRKPVLERHQGLVEACRNKLIIPKQGSLLKCQHYIPFAEAIAEKLIIFESPSEISFVRNIAILLNENGFYIKASNLYEKILHFHQNKLGINNIETATSYNNLAIIYKNQGLYDKSLLLYEKALQIQQNVLGENHLSTAASYNNLAALYQSQGLYNKSLPYFKKALLIRQNILSENHPITAKSYNNLAMLYDKQGLYDKALPLLEKTLQIRQNILGENHPTTAVSYNNLACLYSNQGLYDKALPLYEKALQIQQNTLGENHPKTASGYNNLAALYDSQRLYDKAMPLYEKALQIRQNILGENHPDTASSYNNLAHLYHIQGLYIKALHLYEKALQIQQNTLGENHPETASTYNNLAGLYGDQALYDKALFFFQKALQIVISILGETHPTTKLFRNNILFCCYKMSGSDDSFKDWLEQQQKNYNE